MTNLNISYSDPHYKERAELAASELGLPLIELSHDLATKSPAANLFDTSVEHSLYFSPQGLTLIPINSLNNGVVRCEFV